MDNMDIALSQTISTEGCTTSTTSPPHSSHSIATSGSQKSLTTDRQGNTNNNNNNQEQESTSLEDHYDNTNNNNSNNHNNDTDRELKTERGGLLLCSSTVTATADDGDAFWDYVQPLLLPNAYDHYVPSSNSDVHSITESSRGGSTWQSKVLQWHLDKQQRAQQLLLEIQRKQQEEAEQAMQPKRRGRKKRKKEEPTPSSLAAQSTTDATLEPLEWYYENVLANSNNHKRQRKVQAPAMIQNEVEEYKASVMEHFWRRHKGKLGLAQLETRVQLSAGKGMYRMKWR
jgi:hypothetical protein